MFLIMLRFDNAAFSLSYNLSIYSAAITFTRGDFYF